MACFVIADKNEAIGFGASQLKNVPCSMIRDRLSSYYGYYLDWRERYCHRHPRRWKWLKRGFWVSAGLLGLYLVFDLSVRWGAFGTLPDKAALRQIQKPLASEIYAADGPLLGRYYIENRSEVNYEDMPPHLIQALLAAEDIRFFKHRGVDHWSMLRVMFKSILMGDRSAGGGSTLSQQLAKNLFPRRSYGILSLPVNKMKEVIIARRLERIYSKEQILSHYLNTVSFGEQAFGIGTAAKRFFDKSVVELHVEEAATLVGMLKATSYYNPRTQPERCIIRRNIVISQMRKYDFLTAAQSDSLQALPLGLRYRRFSHSEGPAPYFRSFLRTRIQSLFAEQPQKPNLFTEGLRIYTSLDSRLQAHAEAAVQTHISRLQKDFDRHWGKQHPWGKDLSVVARAVSRSDRYRKLKADGLSDDSIQTIFARKRPMRLFSWEGERDSLMSPLDSVIHYARMLHAGLLALDPQTGEVKAWVGGIDHHYFKYDHVTARRQVGSTFKPILYATALEAGRDPCDHISAEQVVYEDYDAWSPANADGAYEGSYSLQGGLIHSVNTVSAALIMETGPGRVADLAARMGATASIPREPAIALGAADLSLWEMVAMYAVFARDGYACEPRVIRRIEDRNGNILYQAEASTAERVLYEETALMMTRMLQSVVDSGTARRLRWRYKLPGPIAGKTGTTQEQADGWFIGYTPKLVAGVWTGGEERAVRFRSLRLGQGANTALPIWGLFFQKIYADPSFKTWPKARFSPPHDGILTAMDCPTHIMDGVDGDTWDLLRELLEQSDEKRAAREQRRRLRREARRKLREM